MKKILKNPLAIQVLAISLGIISGVYANQEIILIANNIASIFVQVLKWCSLPMITFSILAATSNMKSKSEFMSVGLKIFKYTIFTTLIAAGIGLLLFLALNPTIKNFNNLTTEGISENPSGLFGFLLISSIILSILISFFVFSLKEKTRNDANEFFQAMYKLVMKIVRFVLIFMPVAIWAFVTLFILEVDVLTLRNLSLYLACIVLANLTQAMVVLPLLLRKKKVPVISTFQGMFPALNLAFWSKSSGVALPLAIENATKNLKIKDNIAKFSLPLCTTINMNACAAFILITVLFVTTSNGMEFSAIQLILGIFVATIAAVGNAGVPMGCFTLATALISALGAPLYLMGIIIPFYSIIDMLESSINVWSDSCITAIVNKEV